MTRDVLTTEGRFDWGRYDFGTFRRRDFLTMGRFDCKALKRRSTTHALVDIMHHWHNTVDEGQSVRAVFVDVSKAFDHIDHNILVAKNHRFGLSDTVVC